MDIRKAEAKANAGKPVIDPKTLDEYKEEPVQKNKKLTGILARIDCQGTQADTGCAKSPFDDQASRS